MNTPINHHYVPRHFLEAWATQKKVNRYRLIKVNEETSVKFKRGVPISSCASEDHLYVVSDGIAHEEFETSIMTEQLDTPASLVIAKIRKHGIASLSSDEKNLFARYVTSLEARNPKTIAKMRFTLEDVIHRSGYPPKNELDIWELLLKTDTGKLAAGAFASWGHTESTERLMSSHWVEKHSLQNYLVTSNYPVGKVGDYNKPHLAISIAISPSHAIFFLPDQEWENFLDGIVWEGFVNFLTIANATDAYSGQSHPDSFIEKHLGWKERTKQSEQQELCASLLKTLAK